MNVAMIFSRIFSNLGRWISIWLHEAHGAAALPTKQIETLMYSKKDHTPPPTSVVPKLARDSDSV